MSGDVFRLEGSDLQTESNPLGGIGEVSWLDRLLPTQVVSRPIDRGELTFWGTVDISWQVVPPTGEFRIEVGVVFWCSGEEEIKDADHYLLPLYHIPQVKREEVMQAIGLSHPWASPMPNELSWLDLPPLIPRYFHTGEYFCR
jgi:hypothetical protein